MRAFGARVLGLAFVLLFMAPLLMIRGGRAIFVPSAAWSSWSLSVYLWSLLGAFALLALGHWLLVERPAPKAVPTAPAVILKRMLTGFIAILLPVWLYGVVYGFVRNAVDGPVIERLEMVATVTRYTQTGGGKYRHQYLTLHNEAHGTFRLDLPARPAAAPKSGAVVRVTGYRTWVGDTYADVDL